MPHFKVIIVIILIFLQGCTFIGDEHRPYVYLTNGVKFSLLDLKNLPKNKTLNQYFKSKYKDQSYNMNVVSQFSENNLKMVALTDFGSRIFTIDYSNGKLDFSQSPIAKNSGKIKPEYILADMQLIYWPLADIKNNLDGKIEVTETTKGKLKRQFFDNGKLIIEITYDRQDKWRSNVHYINLMRNYEYVLTNL